MRADGAGDAQGRTASWGRPRRIAWQLFTSTVAASFRHRLMGLAAEAAFFAILSLPPLIFALAGSIGFFVSALEVAQVETLRDTTLSLAGRVLTDESIETVIRPTMDEVLEGGRVDVVSIGFLLALWSGSRALNVFVDTITILYGLAGRRGVIRTRALSFGLYVVGLVVGVIVLPLVLVGPRIIDSVLPDQLQVVATLYWPTVIVLSVAFLTSLYHLSVPVRTSWRHDVPGASLALLVWILGSFLLRWALQGVIGGTSIYGPLAAPIAVLLWLYLTAVAILIGAALNAACDRVWPDSETARARVELVRRLRSDATSQRLRDTVSAEDRQQLEHPDDVGPVGETPQHAPHTTRPDDRRHGDG
ncbi:YihY/virulence factor BrkB family protein [Janibacter cremeus]|uniref:YihY/virulence factor BrkB family protein n=1 Tax=Janibacter cremeus TaxID=1285192 RepID=UPI0023F761EB|nr:YihY/virulence factor BrkB family protein [Janibacter cremeus]WEV76602.1 YihY/virulence factor BrkB family protein [Janibacter cremeus]